MSTKPEKKGLGRGLSALMSDVNLAAASESSPRRADTRLPIEKLVPNPLQPRRDFDEAALEALAQSIGQKGVIQPLIVRPVGDHYEIVAGERRWRAAQKAQQHDVPVVIRTLDDTEVLEIAIIENIQREDLNSIEEALGIRQLMDRFGHTQEKIAEALSKSRSHIANLLRLLALPETVQNMVRDGKLTAGHVRPLIGNDKATELANKIVANNLSVREVEKLVKPPENNTGVNTRVPPVTRRAKSKDADTLELESDLSAHLGQKVEIALRTATAGVVTVAFANMDELDRLVGILNTAPAVQG